MSDDAASLIDQTDLLAPVIAGVSGVPVVRSAFGALYARDCMDLMAELPSEGFDTIFADPPFNIGKQYGAQTDDNLIYRQYLRENLLDTCVIYVNTFKRLRRILRIPRADPRMQ